ncbi:MAG: type II toxin-antitoxin system HicB family antitoxin [Spirochaetaceae bacterium]|jgi:hypothetical protein|nr:type II toxin-antitoxin system HicB family antitoxin [Spirochaetaceae bacterium]
MNIKYTYTQEKKFLVGHLDDFPEYPTQGENREDLENGLREIYAWIKDGTLEGREHKGVLKIAG